MHLAWTAGFMALTVSLGGAWVFIFFKIWTRSAFARTVAINVVVLVMIVALLGGVGEVYCYLFRIQSDGCAFTLANRRWMDLYWSPLNAQGYRDREHSAAEMVGARVLCVLGDSLAAGWGIADREERFGERLGSRLGASWRVVNVATPGWDTGQELEALKAYPWKPEVLVLEYFINDIDGAAGRGGVQTRPAKAEPPWGFRFLVSHSFLASDIFWNLAKRLRSDYRVEHYGAVIQECYESAPIWNAHRQEIADLAAYTRANGIRCVVVVFPYLFMPKQTAGICEKVSRAFEEEQVSVVNMAPLLAARDPRSLVCNSADGHPNAKLHQEVADLLYKRLVKEGVVTGEAK